jgi:quercetin dioxygenase-like cupin family protein
VKSEFQSAIIRTKSQPAIDRGNGAKTIPIVRPEVGSTQFLNGFTIFEPGATIGEHFHNCEESVLVTEGDAIVVVAGVVHQMTASEATWIAPGVPHFFRNPSATDSMTIFWTYASVDATRTSVATGETRTIAAEQAKAWSTKQS